MICDDHRMPSPWKDFGVEKLRGAVIPNTDGNSFQTPSLATYNKWMVNIKKTLGACKQSWILKMALKLNYQEGDFLPVVDPPDPDCIDGLPFKYVTVQNVLDAGGQQSLPEPEDPQRDLYSGDHLDLNYKYTIKSIAHFSAQMSL